MFASPACEVQGAVKVCLPDRASFGLHSKWCFTDALGCNHTVLWHVDWLPDVRRLAKYSLVCRVGALM